MVSEFSEQVGHSICGVVMTYRNRLLILLRESAFAVGETSSTSLESRPVLSSLAKYLPTELNLPLADFPALVEELQRSLYRIPVVDPEVLCVNFSLRFQTSSHGDFVRTTPLPLSSSMDVFKTLPPPPVISMSIEPKAEDIVICPPRLTPREAKSAKREKREVLGRALTPREAKQAKHEARIRKMRAKVASDEDST